MKTKELADSWIVDTEEHISPAAVQGSSAKILPKNTVLLAMYGATAAMLGLLRRPMTCNQACCAMIVDSRQADHRFLFYSMLAHRAQLKGLAVGAAQQNLSGRLLRSFRLPFPPLPEQRRLAAVLGALDDKIELNRKMNRTLEAMAQAILDHAVENSDPTEGMAPVGWSRTTLGALVDQFGGAVQTGPFGSQLHASDYVDQGVPSVMPKNLKLDRVSTRDIARITEEDAQRLSKHRIEPGDIIYSRRGDVERRALATERERGWLCGTGCLRVRLSAGLHHQYLYWYLGHAGVRGWIVRHAQGATMPNLNTKILRSLPVVVPPMPEADRLDGAFEPLFLRREANYAQMSVLASLRDALLPKLISGELRVPEAEVAVEAVL